MPGWRRAVLPSLPWVVCSMNSSCPPCPPEHLAVQYGGHPACERCGESWLRRPGCAAAIVDRHVEKNGGTTMRTLLEQVNAGWHGRCAFVGYAFDRRKVESILRSGTRVCAEAHGAVGPRFWEKELPQLRALQLRVGACSGIKVVLRVREPFAWYVSWYLWEAALGGRQKINASSLPGNLQARILASGYTSTRHLSGQRGPLSPGESARARRDVMLQRRISFFRPSLSRRVGARRACAAHCRLGGADGALPRVRRARVSACGWLAQPDVPLGKPGARGGRRRRGVGLRPSCRESRRAQVLRAQRTRRDSPRFPEIPRDSPRLSEIPRDSPRFPEIVRDQARRRSSTSQGRARRFATRRTS